MSDEKHSPGPWRWSYEFDRAILVDAAGDFVVSTHPDDDQIIVRKADARLIADAPETKREHAEMLTMLREIEWNGTSFCDDTGSDPGCPSCDSPPPAHREGCKLAELIARIDARSAKR